MGFLDKLKKAKEAVGTLILSDNIPEEKALAEDRFDICEACPRLRKPLNQCAECGCLMNAKVRLRNASCPLKKW